MKTKLLRKIRKRFEYAFGINKVYTFDNKLYINDQYNNINHFIINACIDLNLSYLYCYNRKSTIRKNRKYFDSLKLNNMETLIKSDYINDLIVYDHEDLAEPKIYPDISKKNNYVL